MRLLDTVSLLWAMGLLLVLPAHAQALQEVQAVPHLDERGRAAYRAFLAAEPARAFVIAPGGSWAWRAGMATEDAALAAALADCQRLTEQRCVPYAVNDSVVFDARAWVRLWGPYAPVRRPSRRVWVSSVGSVSLT